MKTDELIDAIAADAGNRSMPVNKVFAGALLAGTLATALIFFAAIGFRPDISEAGRTVRFLFKFAVTISLAIPAAIVTARLIRPEGKFGRLGLALGLAPLLLICGAILELLSLPSDSWSQKLIGSNSRVCLTVVPLLAIMPFTAVMLALRHGAPSNPALAGAINGILSGAVAATFYASNCTDDSPLFVITWYPLAIAIMAVAGTLLGPRVLRW